MHLSFLWTESSLKKILNIIFITFLLNTHSNKDISDPFYLFGFFIRLSRAPIEAAENRGFPGGSVIKNMLANAGYMSLIPALGRSPGEGNGNPLQYCCLENSMDRGLWWATVHGVAKNWT